MSAVTRKQWIWSRMWCVPPRPVRSFWTMPCKSSVPTISVSWWFACAHDSGGFQISMGNKYRAGALNPFKAVTIDEVWLPIPIWQVRQRPLSFFFPNPCSLLSPVLFSLPILDLPSFLPTLPLSPLGLSSPLFHAPFRFLLAPFSSSASLTPTQSNW